MLPRAVLLAALAGSSCALLPEHADDPAPRVRGPIASRAQHPVKLTLMAFRPRTAATQAPGTNALELQSAYSNIFENGTGPGEQVVLDGELWSNTVSWRHGLSECADVEVQLGLLYAADGFLDKAIDGFHDFFHLPNGGHEERPEFAYDMFLEKNGQEIWQLDPYEVGLSDLPVVFTLRFAEESASAPALALRAGVELPTGSETGGFGNGALDYGAGLVASKDLGRWSLSGAVDWCSNQRASSFVGSGVEMAEQFDLQCGAEYRWNDRLSFLTGVVFAAPVTRDFTIPEIAGEILMLDLGAAWDVGESGSFYLAFSEDVLADSGPDFTVLFGWRVGL